MPQISSSLTSSSTNHTLINTTNAQLDYYIQMLHARTNLSVEVKNFEHEQQDVGQTESFERWAVRFNLSDMSNRAAVTVESLYLTLIDHQLQLQQYLSETSQPNEHTYTIYVYCNEPSDQITTYMYCF